jgi:hypothetical protein
LTSQLEIDRLRGDLLAACQQCADDPVSPMDEQFVLTLEEKYLSGAEMRCDCDARSAVGVCEKRCSVTYWLDHGRLAGDLMAILAADTGEDVILYRQVGRIHDIDYVRYPHDRGDPGICHPFPLVADLMVAGVDPRISLAVFEHAGYVGGGCRFSSKLSAALSACEDLATLMSVDQYKKELEVGNVPKFFIDHLSSDALNLVRRAELPKITVTSNSNCVLRVEKQPELFINHGINVAYHKL